MGWFEKLEFFVIAVYNDHIKLDTSGLQLAPRKLPFFMAEIVGALACTASVLLNISPIQDVLDIHRTRSVTERSILPYCMMMVDGANWVVFAVLIEDMFPIGVTNAFGLLAGSFYSTMYLRHSWNDKRVYVRREAWGILFGAVAIIALITGSSIAISILWDRKVATDHVGYVIDFFNVLLYGSPLRLAWKVLRTGSTSGMYLPLSLTITAASALWATYGYLTSDWFVAAPQSVGLVAGIAQLLLFLRFGIADNNQPSVTGTSDPSGRNNTENVDSVMNPEDPGPKENNGDMLSDGSRREGGGRKSGGQLGEPLISGTKGPL